MSKVEQVYRTAFEAGLAELRDCLGRRALIQKKLDAVNVEIASLRHGARALMSLVGGRLEEHPELLWDGKEGMTNAIRAVLQSADGKGLEPPSIRSQMEIIGFDTTCYTQPLATIHLILRRLINQKQIRRDGKRYIWNG